jgi:hypothetical protein
MHKPYVCVYIQIKIGEEVTSFVPSKSSRSQRYGWHGWDSQVSVLPKRNYKLYCNKRMLIKCLGLKLVKGSSGGGDGNKHVTICSFTNTWNLIFKNIVWEMD